MLRYASMRLAQMSVVELAFRHREVVHLVVRTTHDQADEAEATDVLDLFGLACGDREQFAIRERGRFCAPAVETVHSLGVCGDHPLDRDQCAPAPGNRDL